MDFNGVNNSYSSYNAAGTSAASAADTKANQTTDTAEKKTSSAYSDVAATYEPSSKDSTSKTTTTSTNRSAIVAQLKSDAEQRMAQMQSLVTKMFEKQGITIGTADDMWKMLASGNFTADAETIAQAQKDIAEDGYWGVSQTSDRIFDFALALSGGDASKMEEMVKAVEKGFSEATKAWGKEMPSITSDTHSAVMDKFDAWFKDNGSSATTEALLAE